RDRNVTLKPSSRRRMCSRLYSSRSMFAAMTIGMEDHDGWSSNRSMRQARVGSHKASSVMSTAPTPSPSSAQSETMLSHTCALISSSPRTRCASSPSAPKGAKISTRSSFGVRTEGIMLVSKKLRGFAAVDRYSRQHAMELLERFADTEAARPDIAFADTAFVLSESLLYDGNGLVNFAVRFEKSHQQDRIDQVAHVDG